MKYARLENNVVAEIIEMASIEGKFHSSLVFVEANEDTKINDVYSDGTFTTPKKKEIVLTYKEKRAMEYSPIPDQLDMIYWDSVNGTTIWKDAIAAVKAKYPKMINGQTEV